MPDIFISHSSKDKDRFVRPLVKLLKAEKIEVWFDEENILAGDSISKSVFIGLEECVCLILVISPSTLNSQWTWIESGSYLVKNQLVIPLLLDVEHRDIADRLPFLVDRKYLMAATGCKECELVELAKHILLRLNRHKLENGIPDLPFELKDIIQRLNRFGIEKTNELLVFIRNFDKNRQDHNIAFIWTEKIVQWILMDISKRKAMQADNIAHFIKTFPDMNESIKDYLEYFQKIQQIFLESASISSTQFRVLECAILYILDWYTQNYTKILSPVQEMLEVVGPGGFSIDDIKETYLIEKLTLRNDLISDWEEAWKWYKHNQCTFLGVRDICSRKIIAFCTLLPVSERWYQNFLSGVFSDVEIELYDIHKYDVPEFYNIYISSVCVHPDYQGTSGAFTELYNAIIEMFLSFAQREIYIYRLLAEASTLDGERLCRFIDMQKIGETNHNTSIYESYLIPPMLRLKSKMGKHLIEYYSNKYEYLKSLL